MTEFLYTSPQESQDPLFELENSPATAPAKKQKPHDAEYDTFEPERISEAWADLGGNKSPGDDEKKSKLSRHRTASQMGRASVRVFGDLYRPPVEDAEDSPVESGDRDRGMARLRSIARAARLFSLQEQGLSERDINARMRAADEKRKKDS